MPKISISKFSREIIAAENASILAITTAYGMQDYTTLQKVSHEIKAGCPTVSEIVKFHVGN